MDINQLVIEAFVPTKYVNPADVAAKTRQAGSSLTAAGHDLGNHAKGAVGGIMDTISAHPHAALGAAAVGLAAHLGNKNGQRRL